MIIRIEDVAPEKSKSSFNQRKEKKRKWPEISNFRIITTHGRSFGSKLHLDPIQAVALQLIQACTQYNLVHRPVVAPQIELRIYNFEVTNEINCFQ